MLTLEDLVVVVVGQATVEQVILLPQLLHRVMLVEMV